MTTVYLAGPITGKSFDEVVSRYNEKRAILSDFGYQVLSPMTGKGHLRNTVEFGATEASYPKHPVSTNHAIFERDKWMVSQADIVLVDLSNSGDRISIGTTMELAWASFLGKHTVLILPLGNIHEHAFVLEAADIIFYDLEAAYDYLKELEAARVWRDL
jgi:nucleoside 2-deoxyribosyltransferase